MFKMIYINLIVFFSILSSSLCVRPYIIRFVSYTSEYKNEFIQSYTFKLLNNSKVPVFNGSLSLSRDLDKIDLSIKVMANDNSKRTPWKLLDKTIDFCKLIRGEGKRTLSLVNNVLKNFKSFDHLLPDHCPVKKRPYDVRFVSYTYEHVHEFYQALTIKLLNISQVLAFNGSMIYSRDMDKVDITIKATVREQNKRSPWKLLDITFDLCQLISSKGKFSLSLVNRIMKNLRSKGHNLPDKCPIKKDIEYYINNFYVDPEFLPPRVPYFSLNIFLGLTHKNIQFYNSSIGVEVQEKNISRKGIPS